MPENPDVIDRYAVAQEVVNLAALPLILYRTTVHDDWIDYNGHMNEAFSVFLTGYACDALAGAVGAMPQGAMFTAETHVSYHAEVPRHAKLYLSGRLLAIWPKRWQVLYQLFVGDNPDPAASIEQMSVYTENGRAAAFPESVLQKLETLLQSHDTLPLSPYTGRKVGDPRVRV